MRLSLLPPLPQRALPGFSRCGACLSPPFPPSPALPYPTPALPGSLPQMSGGSPAGSNARTSPSSSSGGGGGGGGGEGSAAASSPQPSGAVCPVFSHLSPEDPLRQANRLPIRILKMLSAHSGHLLHPEYLQPLSSTPVSPIEVSAKSEPSFARPPAKLGLLASAAALALGRAGSQLLARLLPRAAALPEPHLALLSPLVRGSLLPTAWRPRFGEGWRRALA